MADIAKSRIGGIFAHVTLHSSEVIRKVDRKAVNDAALSLTRLSGQFDYKA
jgi:hypothetical protein